MRTLAASLLLCAACNQNGTGPLGEPLDQLAGFAGTPVMQPGADCMQCHAPGGNAADRSWTVAGTVFGNSSACPEFTATPSTGCAGGVQGAQVLLTDDSGQSLTLTTNSAGNFYTDQPIGTLTSVMIQKGSRRMVMNLSAIQGGQNMKLSALGVDQPDAGNAVSCNVCHTQDSVFDAPGSLFIPED